MRRLATTAVGVCFKKKGTSQESSVELTILNTHYEQCHTPPPPDGGRIPRDCTHPHGSSVIVWETVVTEVTLHDEDC